MLGTLVDILILLFGLVCYVVILALQASDAFLLGVDNFNVVRQVGRLLDGVESSRPVELINDGDVITLMRKMIERRVGILFV